MPLNSKPHITAQFGLINRYKLWTSIAHARLHPDWPPLIDYCARETREFGTILSVFGLVYKK